MGGGGGGKVKGGGGLCISPNVRNGQIGDLCLGGGGGIKEGGEMRGEKKGG